MSVDTSISLTRRPAPRPGYIIDRATLAALDPLEQMAAKAAIRRGFWILIDNEILDIPAMRAP